MGRIVVFSINGCRHCRAVKAMLAAKGAAFDVVNLDEYPERRAEAVRLSGGRNTVPQVFLNALHVGGATELEALDAQGKLDSMVQAACKDEDSPARPLTTDEYVAKHGEQARARAPEPDAAEADLEAKAVDELVRELRPNVDVRLRRFRLLMYPRCFVGREAVDWLVANKNLSRAAAVEAMRMLYRRKAIHHVAHHHEFRDGPLFYRFQEDEHHHVLNMTRIFDGTARSASAVSEALRKQIHKLYSTFLSDDGNGVDYEGLSKSEDFHAYARATTELQGVKLQGLSRDETLAFFINVYNALVIHGHVAVGNPTSLWSRLSFFDTVAYNIGGMTFALNDIEQGVLRGNKVAPGELRRRFRGSSDPRLALAMDPMDPRIHFALVCGAKSCPPIKVYSSSNVDEALTLATRAFLEDDGNFHVDEEKRVVTVSKIFDWYKKDFGSGHIDSCHWAMLYLPPVKRAALGRLLGLIDSDAGAGWACTGSKVSLKFFPYDWGSNAAKVRRTAPRGGTGAGGGGGGGRAGGNPGSGAGAGAGAGAGSGAPAGGGAGTAPPLTKGASRRALWPGPSKERAMRDSDGSGSDGDAGGSAHGSDQDGHRPPSGGGCADGACPMPPRRKRRGGQGQGQAAPGEPPNGAQPPGGEGAATTASATKALSGMQPRPPTPAATLSGATAVAPPALPTANGTAHVHAHL